ncbi:zygote arrest protein 1 isoform X2 [Balaenoptera musculus]|uniref:Zygote arrest protein 1 isoform X2 n=2 Tax=Balaenoptera musculus TaxID=9771 RepID=A0A8B8XEZ1_BALMU|nr:zygote arrest protein 1 isoform X2 [Balaenoptera musculus]
MAALGDEVLDAYMYPACALYSYPYPYPYPAAAKGKGAAGGGGWRHRDGGYPPVSSSSDGAASSSFPGYGQLAAAEYFHSYQRAQLMALLSQVGPGLAPRPGRASIRDVAVQVNPRRDVSVQCSLGRRTLLRRAREPGPDPEGAAGAGGSCPASPQLVRRGPEQGSPPSGVPRPVRFPRTVAVYSPVASRRLATLLEGAETAAAEQRPGAPDGELGPPAARPRGPEEGEGSARKEPQRPQSEEDEAQAGVPASREQPPLVAGAAGERWSPRSPQPGKERLRFQNRSMATITARTATSDGKVPTCGVYRALTRFTTSSFAEHVRSLITLTEWRISPVKIVNRLDAPAQ